MPEVRGRRLFGYLARALLLPLILVVLATGAFAAVHRLGGFEGTRIDIDRVWSAIAILIAALLVQRFTSAVLVWAARGAPDAVGGPVGHVLPLARRALSVAIFVIGALLVLDQLGVSISPLLAGLGISGIAVALALQPLLTNLFAGSYVLSDNSIRVGDHITLHGGPSGRVESIGWRATRMRDTDTGALIIVPNATLAAATVSNYGATGATLAAVTISIPANADLEAVERSAIEALHALAAASIHSLGGVPVVRFRGVTDEGVTLLLGLNARGEADTPLLVHEIVAQVTPRVRAAAEDLAAREGLSQERA